MEISLFCIFWPVEASLLSETLPVCPQINVINL